MGDVREYLTWARLPSHRRKVEQAREVLRRAAERGRLVVSSSWGKDSVALCHLALETLGTVPLVHLASPYRLPGYEEVEAYFAARTVVHALPPVKSLEEYFGWCREIGLPHERSRTVQGKAVQSIKKDRGTEWATAQGFAVQSLGMRAEENPRTRGKLFRLKGPVYQARGLWVACPLAWWSARDVWAYLFAHNLPYNRRIYDAETHGLTRETIRGSGWLSTDGAERGRVAWLRAHFPAEYERLAEEFPRVRMLA